MPNPLDGIIPILNCFLIGFFAGAGWEVSAGLIKFLRLLFGGH
jgi:hypothetical protein